MAAAKIVSGDQKKRGETDMVASAAQEVLSQAFQTQSVILELTRLHLRASEARHQDQQCTLQNIIADMWSQVQRLHHENRALLAKLKKSQVCPVTTSGAAESIRAVTGEHHIPPSVIESTLVSCVDESTPAVMGTKSESFICHRILL